MSLEDFVGVQERFILDVSLNRELKMIKSLYIKNYKLFKELRIERLAQVNLVIGKNNVGKTSLLEATMLFSDDDNIVNNIFNILRLGKIISDAKLSSQQPNAIKLSRLISQGICKAAVPTQTISQKNDTLNVF